MELRLSSRCGDPAQRLRIAARYLSTLVLVARRVRHDPIAGVYAGASRLPARSRGAVLTGATCIVRSAGVLPGLGSRLLPFHAALATLSGRDERARAIVERGLARTTTPSVRAQFAQVALRSGQETLAERALEGLDGVHPSIQRARATVLFRTGRIGEAESLLSTIIQSPNATSGAHRQLEFVRGRRKVLNRQWVWHSAPHILPHRVPGRILHVLTNSLPYKHAGYTIRSQSIAEAQQRAGLDPHMATRAGFPAMQGVLSAPAFERVRTVPYHRIPIDSGTPLSDDAVLRASADGLANLINELRPSCLHPASHHVNAQVALALRSRLDLPIVYEVRGFLEETWLAQQQGASVDHDYYRWSKDAETTCMREADHVVTLSDVMKTEIISRGVTPERITVVPNAVDEAHFVPGPTDPSLLTSYGISPNDSVIGYIGSLVDYEGIPVLLEALRLLRMRGTPVHFLCVGDGPERARLIQMAKHIGVAPWTTFAGRISHDEVLQHYRLLHAFVLPRRDERVCRLVTPMKPLEAMACALPVVSSLLPPLTELSAKGTAGFHFPADDSSALADCLDYVLNHPSDAQRLGDAARQRVVDVYTWSQNGERYRKIYEELGTM